MMRALRSPRLRWVLLLIFLFQLLFLTQLILNYDVVLVSVFFKPITKEYWDWYTLERSPVRYEQAILTVSFIGKWLFTCAFVIAFAGLFSNPLFQNRIGIGRAILYGLYGLVIYGLFFAWIRYGAAHYRLYMSFISTEILSLILWRFAVLAGRSAAS